MGFYIWLTLICFILAYVSTLLYRNKRVDKKLINIIDFAPYLILIIITGFRYNVGTDYIGYAQNFIILQTHDIPRVEFTFKLIVKAAYLLGLNQQFVFLVYAAITYIFIFLSIKYFDQKGEYRHFIILLILQYVLFNGFNTIRQMVAVSIFFYSLRFIVNRQFIKYFIFTLIAFLFHKASIICLIFYFLLKIEIRKIFPILIFSPIFLFTDLANKLISYFISLSGNSWYEIYLTQFNDYTEIAGGKVLFLFYILAIFLTFTSKKVLYKSKELIIIKLFIWYLILMFICLSSVIATRILYFPMVSIILVIPFLTKYFKGKQGLLFIRYSLFIFICLLWITSLTGYKNLFKENNILDYSFKIFMN
ncbi:EpsG family protein [Peribacillus sp. NPDC076916]|uniref:EpsG family protein n=1 Tax=Peribacillus sp. NPDC076916 TaxID=3390608 RepID=UPI003D0152F4